MYRRTFARIIHTFSTCEKGNMMRSIILSGALATLFVTSAAAQSPPPLRDVYVNVNLGFQAKSADFTEASVFPAYDEVATLETDHSIGGISFVDIAAGVRVWRNMSVGGAFTTRFNDNRDGNINASIPHPLFHDAFRNATGLTPLEYSERAIHLHALWSVPVTEEFDVGLFFGPSFFTVKEDLVQSLSFGESSDFSAVMLGGIETQRVSKSAAGFNIGLEGAYMLTRHVGANATIRFSHGTVELPLAGGSSSQVDAGGFDIAAGVRFRF